jgi:hypothetical protein
LIPWKATTSSLAFSFLPFIRKRRGEDGGPESRLEVYWKSTVFDPEAFFFLLLQKKKEERIPICPELVVHSFENSLGPTSLKDSKKIRFYVSF